MSTIERRFWAKVTKTATCWLWIGASNGYGRFNIDGTIEYAHRVSFMLAHGAIPAGMAVCHNCPGGDNPLCVNPAHLFLGTQADNNADCRAKGRHSNGVRPRGERHKGAKLNDANVLAIRERRAMGASHNVIAREFGVSRRTIADVLDGRKWTHV